MTKETTNKETVVSIVSEPLSPSEKALFEAGKKLLVDSIDVGRGFCQFMITTSFAAIPTYIALLHLIFPQKHAFHTISKIKFLGSPFLFLLASIFFALGYYPKKTIFSLDLPNEIKTGLESINRVRQIHSFIGFSIFLIGILFGVCVL